jgi:hypothetical protein
MEKKEMKQIMEMLKTILASMDAHQARINAETEAFRAETEAIQARTKARQEKLDANKKTANIDIIEEMDAKHKKVTDRNDNREETVACQEKTEARLEGKEEATSVDMEPEVAHEEVPVEDAVVMPVGEPRKRRRDRRNLAAGRHQQKENRNLDARRRRNQQKLSHSQDGCRRNLVAARRGHDAGIFFQKGYDPGIL